MLYNELNKKLHGVSCCPKFLHPVMEMSVYFPRRCLALHRYGFIVLKLGKT